MPESEPKPRLIELVAPGAGQGWKAVLKTGKAAVVHEIPVPAAEAAAAVPRIQRLAEHRHPALSPVLGWGTDPNGIWVAVEPNEGTPLGTILSRGPLTPPAAAALGAAVLSGVAALHEDGIAMGGFNASAIRVTGNGEVRLAGHPAAAVRGAPSQSDLRADVRSCGMAVCAAFGVDPAGAPAPPNIPPGLVVTMRSMASGAMGPAADRAQGALREMAAALLSPDRMQAAQSELALRAGGREMPSITPFLPKETVPPPAAAPYVPPSPREETPAPRAAISYEAPPRPLESYSSIPTAPAPAPTPTAPPPTSPSPSPIPTWSEAPPRTPSPFETVAAASSPPAPAAPPVTPPASTPPAPILPTFEPAAPAPRYEPPVATPRYEPPAPAPRYEPPAPTPRYEPPAASPSATNPPASTVAPAGSANKPTWTAITSGVWDPAESEAAAAGATTATTSDATVPPAPARKPLVARRPSDRGPIERPSWLVPAVIAVVLLLLLGTIAGIFLANRGKTTGGTATHSPSPKASPRASPSPSVATLLAVPTDYGPASAPPVESVDFCSPATPCSKYLTPPETATACDLHGACSVEVAIYFTTVQQSGSASYKVEFFDRCTGQKTELPGPTPDSLSGRAVVIPGNATTGLWALTLPSAKSAALIAVSTGTPSAVASAPLLLGANSCA